MGMQMISSVCEGSSFWILFYTSGAWANFACHRDGEETCIHAQIHKSDYTDWSAKILLG